MTETTHSTISSPITPSFFQKYQVQIDLTLEKLISKYAFKETRLSEAIRYSTLLGGKRIRPILALATANCFSDNLERVLAPACAIELVHAYSLIHDDLPAMDDDDLRRGQPTCHKAFDDATAILAGDALQTMAFEVLANAEPISAANRIKIIQSLSNAAGARGMVYGQAFDFESVGQRLDLEELEQMHRHKTGALIESSVVIGALAAADDIDEAELNTLRNYANTIGLAFQVQDDILDVISDTETLGKQQGADIALNKPTYPSLLGLDGAKQKLNQLHEESLSKLEQLQRDTEQLAAISHYIVSRIK